MKGWKPIHMAGRFNIRNRRMTKLKSKGNWFKGRHEVDPPPMGDRPAEMNPSIRMEECETCESIPEGRTTIQEPTQSETRRRKPSVKK